MDIVTSIFSLIILLFSVIIHELAHGYMAYSLGDPTAKYADRLTLNPVKHLDLFGSILLPLLLFVSGAPFLVGWAKPVPVNPHNFRDQKFGSLKVSVVGPAVNIAIAIVFGLLMRFIPYTVFAAAPGLFLIFTFIVQINITLAVFNLIPIPPLDGHWILFTFIPDSFYHFKMLLQQYGTIILITLIVFGGLGFVGTLVANIFHLITGF